MKRFNIYNPLHLLALVFALVLLLTWFGCTNPKPSSVENVPDSVYVENVPDSVYVVINLHY